MCAKEVMVSVCCITYNQEKYIGKALESFLAQKTDFDIEIIVHDDCSSDNTVSVLKMYQKKYPNRIKLVLQHENQRSKGKAIFREILVPTTIGKYIAFCEGDDFWSDPYKLKKQVDVLENNPECSFCAHLVQVVDEKGNKLKKTIPNTPMESGVIDADQWREYLKYDIFVQTSSYMIRGDVARKYSAENLEYLKNAPVGDLFYQIYSAEHGSLYYISEAMSCYRSFSTGSWSSTTHFNNEKRLDYYRRMIEIFKKYNCSTGYIYNDFCLERIRSAELDEAILQKQYDLLMCNDYQKAWKKFSFKKRFRVRVCKNFPFLIGIYYTLKKKRIV